MKRNLQKTMLLLFGLCLSIYSTKAQTTVTVDASAAWNGYMNVFDLGFNYQFGSAWGLGDVKTTVDPGANTVVLQPNFNTYANAVASGAPGDLAYWTNGAGGGNKMMEANSYLESTTLGGAALTFTGIVNSNTLASTYTNTAFIKVLDPAMGYATVLYQTSTLPSTGSFSVSAAIPSTPGLIVQYGFTVLGINANPANEAALGSISISPSFALAIQSTPLVGKVAGNTVVLNWQSANEGQTQKYVVEKSTNQNDFVAVQGVETLGSDQKYSFVDASFNAGKHVYYRIKEVLKNGAVNYSNVITLELPNVDLQVLPNPATSSITIYSNNTKAETVYIYNAFGRVEGKIEMDANSRTIDISQYASGIYFIKAQNANPVQFIKQ